MSDMIPLSEPLFEGNEWAYIQSCLDSKWVSSAGAFVKQFEQVVAEYTGSPYAVAVQSGTAALHLSLLVAGVQAGDLVLIPNLSFVACANAVSYLGASPVLIDVDPETWQMDEQLVESFLTNACVLQDKQCWHRASGRRVKAIVPVHTLGYLAPVQVIQSLAQSFGLVMIEDAAEALGSWLGKRHAGTIGMIGCLSFNGNKIITTGGGGMILTSSEELAQQVRHLSTQAKSHPHRYDHDAVGYNYRLSNIHAALGVAQMETLPSILSRKAEIEMRYRGALGDSVSFPSILPDSLPNHWLPTFCSPKVEAIRDQLNQEGIQSRPLWTPMNQLPMYADCIYVHQEDYSGRIVSQSLSLPAFPALKEEQLIKILSTIHSAVKD